jgi:multidrug efflux pump subunit AcrA (membrane-fusion protein)
MLEIEEKVDCQLRELIQRHDEIYGDLKEYPTLSSRMEEGEMQLASLDHEIEQLDELLTSEDLPLDDLEALLAEMARIAEEEARKLEEEKEKADAAAAALERAERQRKSEEEQLHRDEMAAAAARRSAEAKAAAEAKALVIKQKARLNSIQAPLTQSVPVPHLELYDPSESATPSSKALSLARFQSNQGKAQPPSETTKIHRLQYDREKKLNRIKWLKAKIAEEKIVLESKEGVAALRGQLSQRKVDFYSKVQVSCTKQHCIQSAAFISLTPAALPYIK